MRRPLPPLVAAAVLTVTFQSVTPAGASPADDSADAAAAASIRDWNEFAVTTFIGPPNPIPGPVGPLYLAYLHSAVHDAVEESPDGASIRAAIAAAAHGVLTHYFPDRAGLVDARYAAELAAVPDGSGETDGVAAGQEEAAEVVAERSGDGLDGPALPLPAPGPGVWGPIPASPAAAASWLGTVDPFVLSSPSQLRPDGPPALTSDEWARAYEETSTLGSATSTTRTAEQTAAALFWADPPAVQSQRALRAYSVQEELGATETARLFALVNVASADALIACADGKFQFNFWRPIGAVPAGDTDGNPATVPEPGWTSLVPTPNFPEYPSNHSCSTTAIASVIDGLKGDAPFSFTVTSVRGTPPALADTHTYTSAEQLIREVGNARVWAGIHWRFSVEEGTEIGREVAERVLRADV